MIIVIHRQKRYPGEILLINASRRFAKGRPKNYLPEETIATIAEVYHGWQAADNLPNGRRYRQRSPAMVIGL